MEKKTFFNELGKDISMVDYLEGEESLLKLCDRIYKETMIMRDWFLFGQQQSYHN